MSDDRDPRVARALDGIQPAVSPEPDWGDVVRRQERRATSPPAPRGVRRWAPSLVSTAVAVGLIGVLFLHTDRHASTGGGVDPRSGVRAVVRVVSTRAGQTVEELVASGTLMRSGGEWRLDPARAARTLRDSPASAVERRIATFDSTDLRVARTLAIFGDKAQEVDLITASGASGAAADAALEGTGLPGFFDGRLLSVAATSDAASDARRSPDFSWVSASLGDPGASGDADCRWLTSSGDGSSVALTGALLGKVGPLGFFSREALSVFVADC